LTAASGPAQLPIVQVCDLTRTGLGSRQDRKTDVRAAEIAAYGRKLVDIIALRKGVECADNMQATR
jgi:hypothetical protein